MIVGKDQVQMDGKESILGYIKVNAYGRELAVLKEGESWQVFDIGNESKKRLAGDIRIPDSTDPAEVVQYLGDLLHESASDHHPAVFEHD